jgi:hypothetical protein
VILANQTNRPLSEILGVTDKYISFCIDETAQYVYWHWKEKTKNEAELKDMMKHSKKRK